VFYVSTSQIIPNPPPLYNNYLRFATFYAQVTNPGVFPLSPPVFANIWNTDPVLFVKPVYIYEQEA
jgi:hypothetical protein